MIEKKYIEVDRHFIREKVNSKVIEISFVRSGDQLADMLTKTVSGKVFTEFLGKLGMIDIYISV
jgi:hypothetical protein